MKTWTCQKCGRDYPDEGKPIRCLCPAGGSALDVPPRRDRCIYRGAALREVPCGCKGKPYIYECSQFGECIPKLVQHPAAEPFACCQSCDLWESAE